MIRELLEIEDECAEEDCGDDAAPGFIFAEVFFVDRCCEEGEFFE